VREIVTNSLRRRRDMTGNLAELPEPVRLPLSEATGRVALVVTIDEVRAFASGLPRAYEALVRDRVKFRVGRIVFLAFSSDEQVMGFGFPKDERAALVAAEPGKFLMPRQSDMRYNWLRVRLASLDQAEMEELVLDAWRMCVPKGVAAAWGPSATGAGRGHRS
jgi:hypothetical protein